MEMVLLHQDLLNIVTGTKAKPDPATNVDEAKAWEIQDGKRRATLQLNLCDQHVPQVRALKTSKEIWDKLQEK